MFILKDFKKVSKKVEMIRKIKIKEAHDDPAYSSSNSMKKNLQL